MSRENEWRKYKNDFLRSNRCTAEQFEREYVAFMKTRPTTSGYESFARKYQITIHPEPSLPRGLRTVLSVNIAAIKVMAKTHDEAEGAIRKLLGQNPRAGDRKGDD